MRVREAKRAVLLVGGVEWTRQRLITVNPNQTGYKQLNGQILGKTKASTRMRLFMESPCSLLHSIFAIEVSKNKTEEVPAVLSTAV